MTSFLLDGSLLLDAGTIGQALDLKAQAGIRDVLVSHAHLDHCHALPFFVVNVFGNGGPGVRIHANPTTLQAIHSHIFNNEVWPDFTEMKRPDGTPSIRLVPLELGREVQVGAYRVIPVPVSHPVPTTGFVLTREGHSLVYTADTGPAQEIWETASRAPDLRAVITEISFPNSHAKLAETTGHLTPALFQKEIAKLPQAKKCRIFIYHIKPEHEPAIRREVKALKMKNVEILKAGKTYQI
jgi:cAMP phosphodiesterase